jgi:hypothetical protein
MAIDGTYSIEIETPIGKQQARVALKTDGHKLLGTVETSMGNTDLTGAANGSDITCEMKLKSPIGNMKLELTARISGNDICGEAKAGNFGSFPFKGKKI